MTIFAVIIAVITYVAVSRGPPILGTRPTVVVKPKVRVTELHGKPVEHIGRLEVALVTDGDTIRVRKDGQEIRIRLDSIDTCEMDQPYGKEAKQTLSELVLGKRVEILKTGVDKYGRTLAFLVVDGWDVSREMLRLGHAWHYKQYSASAVLAADERDARFDKRRLWATKNPVPPWEWRKR